MFKSFLITLIFLFLYVISKKSNLTTILLLILIGITIKDYFKKENEEEENKIYFKKENEKDEKEIINHFKKENEEEENKIYFKKENEEENKFIKQISFQIINHFNIPKNKSNIIYNHLFKNFKNLNDIVICDYLFSLFYYCNDIEMLDRLNISTYIVWNSNNQQQIDAVYDKIMDIASSRYYDNKIKANAIDILMRSNNKKYIDNSKILLERLRQEERIQDTNNNVHQIRSRINNLKKQVKNSFEVFDDYDIELQNVLLEQIRNLQIYENNIIRNQNQKASVYNDTQNVHNHEINENVLNIASSIVNNNSKTLSDIFIIEDELKKYYPEYEKHQVEIERSLNRIKNDSSKFRDGITISIIFDKIIGIISNSKYKSEMIKRLGEELYEMNGLCSTGHMSRLINVIQGFDDIPNELQIKINPKDEIYANIQSYLSSEIQKSDNYEQLMDDMIDTNVENKKRFISFVSDKMKNKVKEFKKDYNNIIDSTTLKLNVEDSLINYLKNENDVKMIMNDLQF